jgi:hypothetical protein
MAFLPCAPSPLVKVSSGKISILKIIVEKIYNKNSIVVAFNDFVYTSMVLFLAPFLKRNTDFI